MEMLFQRYSFSTETDMNDVHAAMLLAMWGVESLHGQTAFHRDARYFLDTDERTCTIGLKTEVSRDLNQLFDGFLRRELRADAYWITHITQTEYLKTFQEFEARLADSLEEILAPSGDSEEEDSE